MLTSASTVEEVLLELECLQERFHHISLKVDLQAVQLKQEGRLLDTMIIILNSTITKDCLEEQSRTSNGDTI